MERFRDVIQWFDRHFITLMFIWLIVVLIGLSVWLTLELRTLSWRRVFRTAQKAVMRFLHAAVVIGLACLLIGVILLAVHNMTGPLKTHGPLPIEGDTFWVQEPERIFFIDGGELVSILTNGRGRRVVLRAQEPLRAYHFSPDTKRVLGVTNAAIWTGCSFDACEPHRIVFFGTVERGTDASPPAASLFLSETAWSPDGSAFVFLKNTASDVSRVSSWFLYDFESGERVRIRTEPLRLRRLYWDRDGRHLFGYEARSLDLTQRAVSFIFYWYRWPLPLSSETPYTRVAVFTALTEDPLTVRDHLTARGIVLFDMERRNLFRWDMPPRREDRTADGRIVGIDKDGYLFYKGKGFFTKRYYRVPRTPPSDPRERTVLRPGPWVITRMAWLPSGRYVIMEHRRYGLVLFDPRSGRMGIIENKKGHSFGWPTPITSP